MGGGRVYSSTFTTAVAMLMMKGFAIPEALKKVVP